MIKLPKTIRSAYPSEIPCSEQEIKDIIYRMQNARIDEGYFIIRPEETLKYSFFAEINCNIDKVWDLFIELANTIPNDELYSFIKEGVDNDLPENEQDLFRSNLIKKKDLINIFEKFKFELINDPFLDFGLLFYNDYIFEEVYVSPFKYLQFWGNNKETFEKVVKKFNLHENNEINFIDQFPVVRTSLNHLYKDKNYTDITIKELQDTLSRY